MAISAEELDQATATVTLPDNPADLAKARGDAPAGSEVEAPAAAAPALPLTEDDKAEAAVVVEGLGKKPDEPEKKEEGEAEPARGPDGKFIPKGRFDEMRIKKDIQIKAAEARAEAAEARAKAAEPSDDIKAAEAAIDAKTDVYQGLLADGKLKEAKVVFAEINSLNRQIARLEMAPQVAGSRAADKVEDIQAATLQGVVDMYLAEFPEFESDQALINEVSELQAGFEALRYSPAAALRKAADLVIKSNSLAPLSERAAPAKAEKPAAKPDKGAERKADAIKAGVAASKQQPPQLDNAGIDSDKAGASNIDWKNLSQADFEKLPESTIKRARGDHFAG